MRPRRCPTSSNPVPWQNWMAAYLGYTLWMKTLFCGWPVMVDDTHTAHPSTASVPLADESGKVILDPHSESCRHQNLTTFRGSPLAHAYYHVWLTFITAFVNCLGMLTDVKPNFTILYRSSLVMWEDSPGNTSRPWWEGCETMRLIDDTCIKISHLGL